MGLCASSDVKVPSASKNKMRQSQYDLKPVNGRTKEPRIEVSVPDYLGDDFSHIMNEEEEDLEADRVIQTGVHCSVCDVCPIEGPVYVYNDLNLSTLCKKCTSSSKTPSSTSPTRPGSGNTCKSIKCVNLAETLSCMLSCSGLLSNKNKITEENFVKFWKILYPEMPDYQVNALIASVHIDEGIEDIHSDSFIELWLDLSSEEKNIVKDVTHRQLECYSHGQCKQPFGATPILGFAYLSLEESGVLKSYCNECFRELQLARANDATKSYEKCRTEQESMSAAFLLGCSRAEESEYDLVNIMDGNGNKKLPIDIFAALYGYNEKMSGVELRGFCDHIQLSSRTKTINFQQFCVGSLILAGAHETLKLSYTELCTENSTVRIGMDKSNDNDLNDKRRQEIDGDDDDGESPNVQVAGAVTVQGVANNVGNDGTGGGRDGIDGGRIFTNEGERQRKEEMERRERKMAKAKERIHQKRESDKELQRIRMVAKMEHQTRMDGVINNEGKKRDQEIMSEPEHETQMDDVINNEDKKSGQELISEPEDFEDF
jgi:hypothetical protein